MSPFPWQVYDFETIISLFVDGFLRYIIIYFLIKIFLSIKKESSRDKNIIVSLFLIIIITNIIFSLGVNNYGQAMRHRTKTLPVEIVLIFSYFKKEENDETNKI